MLKISGGTGLKRKYLPQMVAKPTLLPLVAAQWQEWREKHEEVEQEAGGTFPTSGIGLNLSKSSKI